MGKRKKEKKKRKALERHCGSLKERHLPIALQAGGMSLPIKGGNLGLNPLVGVCDVRFLLYCL